MQKVLRYKYIPGLKTFSTYLVPDQIFKKNLREWKKIKYFWQKNEGAIIDGNFDGAKKMYIFAVLSKGGLFRISFQF